MSPRTPSLGAIVLAAGRSKRFGGAQAKVLHPLCGRPILEHILETLRTVHSGARLRRVCVVVPPGKEVERVIAARKYPFEIVFAVQRNPAGTGHAARVALKQLEGIDDVLVVAGDSPLVRAESLLALVRRRRDADASGALLTAMLADGGPYGRILRSNEWITGVVEVRDATPEELALHEINTCTYAFSLEALKRALPRLRNDNAQGEYYLTDVVGELVSSGEHLTSVEGDPNEVLGTNTRAEFAVAARLMRERILDDLMDAGVTILDPETTYVDVGVTVGADTILRPNTLLEGATKVGADCDIGPATRLIDTTVGEASTVTFAVAREAKIGPQCSVGPYASLRPGTVLRRGSKAGTFSEMKNALIGEGSKVPHFSYLGDVTVGRDSNIGAGTITCNYDGKDKHATKIGDEAFIGSDTILVAPVRVGRGAYTGAGSVVNRDVAPGDLVYGVPATPKKRRRPAKKKAAKRPTKKKGRA